MKSEILSKAEQAQLEFERLTYLQRVLDSLGTFQKAKAQKVFYKTANDAINALREILIDRGITAGVKLLDEISFELLTSGEIRDLTPWNDAVALGSCNLGTSIISIHDQLVLAPKEVIRSVVTHEALHLAHARCFPAPHPTLLEIDEEIVNLYLPQVWQEEQWVRNMEKELTGNKYIAEMWGAAVSQEKARWRKCFYDLKKKFKNENKK